LIYAAGCVLRGSCHVTHSQLLINVIHTWNLHLVTYFGDPSHEMCQYSLRMAPWGLCNSVNEAELTYISTLVGFLLTIIQRVSFNINLKVQIVWRL